MSDFLVHKRDHAGKIVLSYPAERILKRTETMICLQAIFQQSTRDLGYVTLKTGDIFTEWFYTDRWYNIFQIEDVDDGALKGFYCNLTRPTIITAESVSADDLELDIFVKPDGTCLILDQDDYDALPLSADEKVQVDRALADIKQKVAARIAPFDTLSS
ncbi:MAG: DUF402 domain-containing protein [Chloroflexota bacterium]